MRSLSLLLLLAVEFASAFPHFVPKALTTTTTGLRTRQDDDAESEVAAGIYPKISTSGAHAWQAPGPNDKRGPCPALNSLANHGYLPRNGVVGMLQAATVTNEVFGRVSLPRLHWCVNGKLRTGLGLDLSIPLSLYATLLSGDVLSLSWSIGGPAGANLLGPLLGVGKGLSGSHNKYETDASVTHGDFYLFNGDVDSVRLPKFKYLLSLQNGVADPNWTLDVLNKQRNYTLQDSISNNPYFFFGPFSGLLVSNAGHCFVPGMMANFSAQYPQGKVTKKILLSFFAVYEDPVTGVLTHKKGHERIPDNWYRRPTGLLNEYNAFEFSVDLIKMAKANPAILKIGGNTGKVNSFAGVDLGDLTGGAYNVGDLLNPEKLVCFIFRLMLTIVPDFLQGGILGGILNSALNLLTSTLLPLFDPKCPGIQNWNGNLLKQFPGAGLN
ncbi:Chloroperoxidase [Sphaerosporella brunnea]|uniref:Chloroperoxidase n=1 Tax=Sphaerosporella brunnea TaxID=1250544 RepID=A0A5J5F8X0_9PEZI|nr:Chloroperoxidase [Sphaerosporella brunnea]